MPFTLSSLQPVGATSRGGRVNETQLGKNGLSVWQYGSEDPIGTVQVSGYFNEARDLVNRGDQIVITTTGNDLTVYFFESALKSPSTDDVALSSERLIAVA